MRRSRFWASACSFRRVRGRPGGRHRWRRCRDRLCGAALRRAVPREVLGVALIRLTDPHTGCLGVQPEPLGCEGGALHHGIGVAEPFLGLGVGLAFGVPVDVALIDDIAVGVDVFGVLIEPNGPVLRVGDHRFIEGVGFAVVCRRAAGGAAAPGPVSSPIGRHRREW